MRVFFRHEIRNGDTLRTPTTAPLVYVTQMRKKKYYLLIMIDPDAVGGSKIHWLVVNLGLEKCGMTLLPYVPPQPPKGSGKHHYIFYLIEYDQPLKKIIITHRYVALSDLITQLDLSQFQLIASFYFIINTKKMKCYHRNSLYQVKE